MRPNPRRAYPRPPIIRRPPRIVLLLAGCALLVGAAGGTVAAVVTAEPPTQAADPNWRGTQAQPRPTVPHVDRYGTRAPLPEPAPAPTLPVTSRSPVALSKIQATRAPTPRPTQATTTRAKATTRPQPQAMQAEPAPTRDTPSAPRPSRSTLHRKCPALPGITDRTRDVHQALCDRFPAITSFGGVRPDWDVEHPSGRALDAMVSNPATGNAVADWARANATEYGITEVIWNARIWTSQRASDGWRQCGTAAASCYAGPNDDAAHRTHVHVSIR